MPRSLLPVAYVPVANGFSRSVGTKPFSLSCSIETRSAAASPIAPAWKPARLAPLPIMRFSIMCVYSWPMTPASKSPSTHGG
jgi:hypothetical protein